MKNLDNAIAMPIFILCEKFNLTKSNCNVLALMMESDFFTAKTKMNLSAFTHGSERSQFFWCLVDSLRF